MQTRSFIRDRSGARWFWELTWDGGEVEIASGKLGSAGRCEEHVFLSTHKRDVFIAKQIEAARGRGFVEREDDEPEPEPEPDADADAPAPELLARLRRPAFVPKTVDGDGPSTASKFSGRPWLAAGQPWPQVAGAPMQLMLQLDLAALPSPGLGAGFERGLLQVFQAEDSVDLRAPWEPWGEARLVRIVEPSGPESAMPCPLEQPWPARRIVGFEVHDELPHVEDASTLALGLDDDGWELLLEWLEGKGPRAKDKIGGWPHWIQGAEIPRCPKHAIGCRFVAQIDSEDNLPVSFGDSGIMFVWACPTDRAHMTSNWQCC